jgi:adenylate cyclase
MFNWWLIERTRESGVIDIVELSRAFAPVVVMVMIGLSFIVGEVVTLAAFRRVAQQPLNSLIDRMRSVAVGDFSVRTTVLSGDEIGVLKGHFNTMVEGLEEREKIRDTFGRLVSAEIAEKLMSGGGVDLEGQEIITTVMFADIRSFTALSERMAPRDLVTFLNEYFSFVVRPITAERGVVNKFIGDSVMAVFSPVFGVEDHAEAAIRAAMGMRAALEAFNAEQRWETIRQGVGIHTGVLVAGTVGAEDRREYTVIGDTVNVASRIESQTKVAETDILISGATVDLLDPAVRTELGLRETEPVIMRGKSSATRLFLV